MYYYFDEKLKTSGRFVHFRDSADKKAKNVIKPAISAAVSSLGKAESASFSIF